MTSIVRPSLAAFAALSFAAACAGSDGSTASSEEPADATVATTAAPATTAVTTTSPPSTPAAPASAPTTTSEPSTTEPAPEPDTSAVQLLGGAVGDVNAEQVERFFADTPDDGEPFYMVNLIRYREQAEYPDGRATELTGREANQIYGSFMFEEMLPSIGATVMYFGTVELDLAGGSEFDEVAVVEYPSRAAFMAMAEDPVFQEMSVHKDAGVLDTVVMATSPIPLSDVPPVIDPPFPATDADPPFAFMHLLDYHETAEYAAGDVDADPSRTGAEAVAAYTANAGQVALPLGIRPVAWFQVEATIIGPPDTWEEVRINTFPSHATFDALTSDPTWQSGVHHRNAGLVDTYAIMNLPVLNDFAATPDT